MRLLDLVELGEDRLANAAWMERLSIKRGPDCFCLLLSAGADTDVVTRDKTMTLQGESALILSPGTGFVLQVRSVTKATRIYAIFFEVGMQDPLHAVAKRFALLPCHAPREGAGRFFADINARFISGNIFHLRSARHQTASFLYSMAGGLEDRKHGGKKHAYIEKALSYMHMHSSLPVTLNELTRFLNLSEAYFVRLFKRETGVAPMKHFMRLKIHNASLLLMQGLTVRETAERLSFYNEFHFSKLFKQYMGVPPKMYKRNAVGAVHLRVRETEKSLMPTAAMVSTYFDSISDMVFIKDTAFIYRGCNAAFCQYVGKKKEDIFGQTDFTLFPKEIAENYRKYDRRILVELASYNNKEWVGYPDGKTILVEASKSPYFSPDGELLGIIGVSRAVS